MGVESVAPKNDENDEFKRIQRKKRAIQKKERRLLSIISYFTRSHFVSEPAIFLRECDCFKIPFDEISVMFLEQNNFNSNHLMLHALNGVIVGLGAHKMLNDHCPPFKKRKIDQLYNLNVIKNEQQNITNIECVGLGIIRSINVKKRLFYLITPIQATQINKVNVFIRGKTHIPPIFLYDSSILTPPSYINSTPMNERILTATS